MLYNSMNNRSLSIILEGFAMPTMGEINFGTGEVRPQPAGIRSHPPQRLPG
jgi:hypothetical protein